LDIGLGIPTVDDLGRGRVESVITFVIERHGLQCVLSLFDIRAGSDFIISEVERASGLSFGVWIKDGIPLFFRNDLDLIRSEVC